MARSPDLDRTVTVDGNRLTLLDTGAERMAAAIAMIDGANTSLRLLYYMFSEDEAGVRVRDALVRAIGRGVSVSLLVDGFGSNEMRPEFLSPIDDAGGSFCIFHPRWGRRYLIRNHQKLIVADDARALVGGANINQHYMTDNGAQHWRDLWLKMEGPAVLPLTDYFDSLERWTRKKDGTIRQLRRLINRHSRGEGAVRWRFSGPMRRRNPWPSAIVRDILAAKDLTIIAAYFAPSWAMLRRIWMVVRRGGRARVVTAAKSDNNATIAAARFTYKRLLKNGVRMFEYQPARLHTKLYLADDVVHLGSANFDFRSIYLNLEMMVRIEDRAFAQLVRDYADGEISDSLEISAELHRKRATITRRFRWAASYALVTSVDYTVTRRLNFGIE